MSIRLVARALAILVTATAVVTPVAAVMASSSHPAPPVTTLTASAIPALGVLSADPVRPSAPAPVPTAETSRPVAQLALEPLRARKAILYGDSLAWQAQEFFVAALAGAGITQVTTRTFGGTAICDWFADMRADAVAIHPDVVVVEFSGNALTPCRRPSTERPCRASATSRSTRPMRRPCSTSSRPVTRWCGSPARRSATGPS